jgi:methanogenic corrinoid protein MtbC1
MEAGLSDHVWELSELVELLDKQGIREKNKMGIK